MKPIFYKQETGDMEKICTWKVLLSRRKSPYHKGAERTWRCLLCRYIPSIRLLAVASSFLAQDKETHHHLGVLDRVQERYQKTVGTSIHGISPLHLLLCLAGCNNFSSPLITKHTHLTQYYRFEQFVWPYQLCYSSKSYE